MTLIVKSIIDTRAPMNKLIEWKIGIQCQASLERLISITFWWFFAQKKKKKKPM